MSWQFADFTGGNVEPVRTVCEFDWTECPLAVANYVWSEIVTEVADCLADEAIFWRLLVATVVATMLLQAVYRRARRTDQALSTRQTLDKVGFKVQDLELKVNVLSYKVQYGTWPLPHQVPGESEDEASWRLRDDWTRRLFPRPGRGSSTPRGKLTRALPETKFAFSELRLGSYPARSRASGEKSWRRPPKNENLGLAREAPRSGKSETRAQRRRGLAETRDDRDPCGKFARTVVECRRFMDELKSSNRSLGLVESSSGISGKRTPRNATSEPERGCPGSGRSTSPRADPVDASDDAKKTNGGSEERQRNGRGTDSRSYENDPNAPNGVKPATSNRNELELERPKSLPSSLRIDFRIEPMPKRITRDVLAPPRVSTRETLLRVKERLEKLHNVLRTYETAEDPSRIDALRSSARALEELDGSLAESGGGDRPDSDGTDESSPDSVLLLGPSIFEIHREATDHREKPEGSPRGSESGGETSGDRSSDRGDRGPTDLHGRDREDDQVPQERMETETETEEAFEGRDSDDESTETLLEEALRFKKALLRQLQMETELDPDPGTSKADGEDSSRPKVENHFQSKLLDVIAEEQSASSSTEKTGKIRPMPRITERRVDERSGLCLPSSSSLVGLSSGSLSAVRAEERGFADTSSSAEDAGKICAILAMPRRRKEVKEMERTTARASSSTEVTENLSTALEIPESRRGANAESFPSLPSSSREDGTSVYVSSEYFGTIDPKEKETDARKRSGGAEKEVPESNRTGRRKTSREKIAEKPKGGHETAEEEARREDDVPLEENTENVEASTEEDPEDVPEDEEMEDLVLGSIRTMRKYSEAYSKVRNEDILETTRAIQDDEDQPDFGSGSSREENRGCRDLEEGSSVESSRCPRSEKKDAEDSETSKGMSNLTLRRRPGRFSLADAKIASELKDKDDFLVEHSNTPENVGSIDDTSSRRVAPGEEEAGEKSTGGPSRDPEEANSTREVERVAVTDSGDVSSVSYSTPTDAKETSDVYWNVDKREEILSEGPGEKDEAASPVTARTAIRVNDDLDFRPESRNLENGGTDYEDEVAEDSTCSGDTYSCKVEDEDLGEASAGRENVDADASRVANDSKSRSSDDFLDRAGCKISEENPSSGSRSNVPSQPSSLYFTDEASCTEIESEAARRFGPEREALRDPGNESRDAASCGEESSDATTLKAPGESASDGEDHPPVSVHVDDGAGEMEATDTGLADDIPEGRRSPASSYTILRNHSGVADASAQESASKEEDARRSIQGVDKTDGELIGYNTYKSTEKDSATPTKGEMLESLENTWPSSNASSCYEVASSRASTTSNSPGLSFDKSILNPPTSKLEISALAKSTRNWSTSVSITRSAWNSKGDLGSRGSATSKNGDARRPKSERLGNPSALGKCSSSSKPTSARQISSTTNGKREKSSDSPRTTLEKGPSSKGGPGPDRRTWPGSNSNPKSADEGGTSERRTGVLPRRSRSYVTPRPNDKSGDTSPRLCGISRRDERSRSGCEWDREISRISVERSSNGLEIETHRTRTPSRSCIPVLRNRATAGSRNSQETRGRSPRRGPLTITASTAREDEALRESGDLGKIDARAEGTGETKDGDVDFGAGTSAESGNAREGKDETRKGFGTTNEDGSALEDVHAKVLGNERSADGSRDASTVIYVNIVTDREQTVTRVVDPKRFLECMRDRELMIQVVDDGHGTFSGSYRGNSSADPSDHGTGKTPNILAVVSSTVDRRDDSPDRERSGASNPRGSTSNKLLSGATLKGSWSLRVEPGVNVPGKSSAIDVSTSISDLPEDPGEGSLRIVELPGELAKKEHAELPKTLDGDPGLAQLQRMRKSCHELGLGLRE